MFLLEKHMTPVLTDRLDQLSSIIREPLDIHTAVLALELPVKYRMVDIAIAYSFPCTFPIDITSLKCFKYLNSFSISILSFFWLYKRVSLQKLQRELFLENDLIKKYIHRFLKYNLITQVSRNTYTANQFHSLRELRLISIELKLLNWKEALEQAEFNLQFSDFSFVALDKSRVANYNDMLPFFKKKNIGLLALSTDGEIDPIFVPKKNKNYDKALYITQRIKIIQDLVLQQKWYSLNKSEN